MDPENRTCKFILNLEDFVGFVVQLWEPLAERVGNVLKDYPALSLTHGRKVGTFSLSVIKVCSHKFSICICLTDWFPPLRHLSCLTGSGGSPVHCMG